MKTADEYRKTWPNKTDDQIIESLGNEVRDKVETIHGLLHDLNEREYTEEDLRKAFNAGDAWGRADYIGNNQPFDDEDDFINSLNK